MRRSWRIEDAALHRAHEFLGRSGFCETSRGCWRLSVGGVARSGEGATTEACLGEASENGKVGSRLRTGCAMLPVLAQLVHQTWHLKLGCYLILDHYLSSPDSLRHTSQ